VSPSQSITPRSSLSVVHSGDVTVHYDGPECTATSPECIAGTGERGLTDWLGDTAARVPTKQIPREQGTLNGVERQKTLYQQTSTIIVGETHDFLHAQKGRLR